jgi:hypothetical protein
MHVAQGLAIRPIDWTWSRDSSFDCGFAPSSLLVSREVGSWFKDRAVPAAARA